MNDPQVVELIYIVDHDASVDYSDASPVDHDGEAFRIRIEDKRVSFQLKEHYPTQNSARKAVERYIRQWEWDIDLNDGTGQFKLTFEAAKIIDRNPLPPPPPSQNVIHLSATITAGAPSMSAKFRVTGPKPVTYPAPPAELTLDPDDPDVLTMYHRFEGYRLNREPLTGMAYFCLSMLEGYLSQDRNAAAREYGIKRDVLSKIGDLTANRGGRAGARKATGIVMDLTGQETRFLEEAVKRIIRRTAEVAHDPHKDYPQIKLSDPPQLSC